MSAPEPLRDSSGDVCLSCLSNRGERRISPGPPVHHAGGWVVEHAYPTALEGWLVIVLDRHAESLHELSDAEAEELGRLQVVVTRALRTVTGCAKTYLLCLAEMPGFRHVHVHVVPRATDLPDELKGARILEMMRAPEEEVVPPERVAELCLALGRAMASPSPPDDKPFAS